MTDHGRGPANPKREHGALESEVMAALWACNEPLTVAQVQTAVGAELNYKTVLTVLTRLLEKGSVDRERDGRGHRYFPVRARADLAAAQMRTALAHTGNHAAALQNFVATLDADDEATLRALLDEQSRSGN